ncbi:MAG TPA: hypothetical protein VG095_01975 [Chthoniobacterales bacterium]|nr:hypothetical protein [Chthoniobacterales bacterium]
MSMLFMIVSIAVGLWKLGRSLRLANAATLRGVISRTLDQDLWGSQLAMLSMVAGEGAL